METLGDLKNLTVKQLAQMAKCRGVPGWHSMRKADLIKALTKILKAEQKRNSRRVSSNLLTQHTLGIVPEIERNGNRRNGSANGRSSRIRGKAGRTPAGGSAEVEPKELPPPPPDPKDLACRDAAVEPAADRVILMVRDSYWLQATWEIRRQTVERARVALGQMWHLAKPILRLVELDPEGLEAGDRKLIRDIEIHGSVNNWFIDVPDPPRSFQVDLGYITPSGKFHCLARSNVVTTRPGASCQWWPKSSAPSGAVDWDRVLALSIKDDLTADQEEVREFLEDKLDRPFGTGRLAPGGPCPELGEDFEAAVPVEIDAEVILYGSTAPGTRVTVRGEPVQVRPDGTFVLRYPLPDRRQVFPIVAWSRDGNEQRTILVAVERNTKVMEPLLRDMEY